MKVSVGSYNVKNMFGKRDLTPDTHTGVKPGWSLDALAENIARVDADVVSLQEVSSRQTLEEFLMFSGLVDEYKHVAHIPAQDPRGINVAVISKFPFTDVTTHQDEEVPLVDGSGSTRFSRDLLRADIDLDDVPGPDLTVYTTHCKSRRPADPGQLNSDLRRASEGAKIREIAEREMAEFPNRLFVITGDFNDNTDDPTVQNILNPREGEPWLDSLDHLSDSERVTWPANPHKNYGHEPEQFDHIIYPASKDHQLVKSEVHNFGWSLDGDVKWLSSTASDHLMITADFEV